MSTWDKIITDSNRITDLTAPNATFSMNSQTIENVLGLEATASTDITLEHGTDKDILLKEEGMSLSGTIGSLGGTPGVYGFKFPTKVLCGSIIILLLLIKIVQKFMMQIKKKCILQEI